MQMLWKPESSYPNRVGTGFWQLPELQRSDHFSGTAKSSLSLLIPKITFKNPMLSYNPNMRKICLVFLILLARLAGAHPMGEIELENSVFSTNLKVEPSSGPAWTRTLENIQGFDTLGLEIGLLVSWSNFDRAGITLFDWQGNKLQEFETHTILTALWADGERIYGLKRRNGFQFNPPPESILGSGIVSFQLGQQNLEEIKQEIAPGVIKKAPAQTRLNWYASRALTPPQGFSPQTNSIWSLGLRAAQGSTEARAELEQKIFGRKGFSTLLSSFGSEWKRHSSAGALG